MKPYILTLVITVLYSSISFAQWAKKEFVDDFGDPTGQYYITEFITNGSFSNSATSNGKLTGRVIVTEYSLYFRLFEYGSSSNSLVEIDNWNVQFKASNGNVFDAGFASGLITGKNLAVLSGWLKKYSSLKVYIEEDDGSSAYSFVINCNGFTKASVGMEFPDINANDKSEFNPVIETDMMIFYKLALDGEDIFGAFNKTNPTVIVDSVGIFYIVQDKDVRNNARVFIKKEDLKNSNSAHFN